jgi:glycosyltransferase involved in cell wall biosynthesis
VGEALTRSRARLGSRRIVVISSSLGAGSNDLWEAARPHVGALAVVGAARRGTHAPASPGEVALPQVDGGRGLIWRHLVGLRRFLASFRPDLVHVNGELWGLTAQELLHLRTPVVVHGAENLWEHGNRLERAVRRRLVVRAVDRIAGYASWNHAGAEHVQLLRRARGRAAFPTLVLPAIIPPEAFRAISWSPPDLDAGARLEILLVGRVVRAKGFHDVVEAAAALGDRRVRITLCGAGPAVRDLEQLARGLDVEFVARGFAGPDTLATLMAGSHLMVQPSLTTIDWAEQFGRTVAEAMTVGLPCLVSSSGELPRLVGEQPAAIFAEGDVAQLTERLRELTRAPGSLEELSQRQRPLAASYDPATSGMAVLNFWAESLP